MTADSNPALPPAPAAAAVPDAGSDPVSAPAVAPRVSRTTDAPGWQPQLVLAWVLAALGLGASVALWQKVSGMQEQLARQSAEAGTQSVEARTLARQAEENARGLSGKVAALETKVADMAVYRTQLDALVQSVARARDENLAVDLDAALRVAQDQTQLTGSVEPLLAALRTAERRLTRSSDPRLAPVVRAVARDLEHVKNVSIPDAAGLLARIDLLLRQVDDLPLANEVGRARPGQAPRGTAAPASPPPESWWARQWRGVLDQAQGLLRVSRIERPEASLLSPEQAFFVRENLKLRLHGARLALLARQYEAVRADLSAASTLLGGWFDPTSRRTQSAATTLQEIQAGTRTADLPRVEDTLTALGNAIAAASAAGSR